MWKKRHKSGAFSKGRDKLVAKDNVWNIIS